MHTLESKNWDVQEIKLFKAKYLVQSNLIFLLAVASVGMVVLKGGSTKDLLGIWCLVCWLLTASFLHTYLRGEVFTTKTGKIVHAFDKSRLGDEEWRKRSRSNLILILIINLLSTAGYFVIRSNHLPLDLSILFPFIGAWMGVNVVGMMKIKKL